MRAVLMRFGWARVAAVATLLCAGATWSACQSAEEEPAPPTAVHAVDSEKLEMVMAQMKRVDGSLLPPELDLGPEQQRRRGEIAQLAGSIAASADGIPSVLDDVPLPEEYRAEFVQMAQDLEDRALELQKAAPGLSTAELQAQLTSLRATCTACHTRFRVLPTVR